MHSLIATLLLVATTTAIAQISPSGCVVCHRAQSPDLLAMFGGDVHNRTGLSCVACHGGDPTARTKTAAKPSDGPSAYKGRPQPTDINELCGTCHTEQFHSLAGGNHSPDSATPNAPRPTCINCHDVHAIGRAGPHIVGDEHCRDCHQGHFQKVLSYSRQLTGAHQNMRELKKLLGDLESTGRGNADMRRAGQMADEALARLKVSAHSADPSRVHEDALGIAQLFERVLEVETRKPKRFKTVDGYLTSLLFGACVLAAIIIALFIVRKRKSTEVSRENSAPSSPR